MKQKFFQFQFRYFHKDKNRYLHFNEYPNIIINASGFLQYSFEGQDKGFKFYSTHSPIIIEQATNLNEIDEDMNLGQMIFINDIVECSRYEDEDLFLVHIKDIRQLSNLLVGSALNYRKIIGTIHDDSDVARDLRGETCGNEENIK